MRFVYILLLAMAMSWSVQGQSQDAPKEWKPHQGPHAEMLHSFLFDRPNRRNVLILQEKLQLIGDKFTEVKPDLEQYLLHPDLRIRKRSFDLLIRYSDTPKQYIVDVLKTPDSPLLGTVMFMNTRKYLKEQAFQDLWINAYILLALNARVPCGTGGWFVQYHVYMLDAESHRRLANSIIPVLLPKLSSFETVNASRIIAFMGMFGDPYDEALIEPIRNYQSTIDSRIAHKIERQFYKDEESVRRAKRGISNACVFALVNLGDPDAFDDYVQDCHHDDIRIRRDRVGFLLKLRPTEDILWLVRDLLNDKSYLVEPSTNGSDAITIGYRPCDVAFYALAKWFDDYPFKSNSISQRKEVEIILARALLTLRLAP